MDRVDAGGQTPDLQIHSGNGPHEDTDRRAIACFGQALADVGLDGDERLRQVLHDYLAWATSSTMSGYHRSAADVPDGLRIPRWSWTGLCVRRAPTTFDAPVDKERILSMDTARYAASMSLTTIKVDSGVRDRLAEIARARGVTMGALLDAESRRLQVEQHWTDVEASYARLRAGDPAGWTEYLDELRTWDAGTGSPDTAAAQEWPEFSAPG